MAQEQMNPEALHDVAASTDKKSSDKFVNPGTPEEALVKPEQMTKATIEGAATETLRSSVIK